MSYQLLTTKRKFDRLLDQISSSREPLGVTGSAAHDGATTSTLLHDGKASSSPAVSPDRVAKRRKFQAAAPKIINTQRSNLVKSSPQLSLLLAQQARKRRQTTGSTENSMAEPTFSPGSLKTFLDRLSSFAGVERWSTKPEAINDLLWAGRGWRVVGRDTVCCDTCFCMVVIDMPVGTSSPSATGESATVDGDDAARLTDITQHELARRYKQKIIDGHSEGCPWRKKGCNETLYHVDILQSPNAAILQLLQRYKRLAGKRRCLPLRVETDAANIDMTLAFQALLSLFPEEQDALNLSDEALGAIVEEADPADVRVRAIALALAGWDLKAVPGEEYFYAQCGMCFRRIGLWTHRTQHENSHDIVGEHRDFCPWANADIQCRGQAAGKAGNKHATEQLAKTLFDATVSKTRRSGELHTPSESRPTTAEHSESRIESASTQHTEQAEMARKERLKGLKKFLGKFKDFGRNKNTDGGGDGHDAN